LKSLILKKPISAVYWDGDKQQFNVKRFLVEGTSRKVAFITEHEKSYLEIASTDWKPVIELVFKKIKGIEKPSEKVNLEEFISVKGLKAIGNRLTSEKIKIINILNPIPAPEKETQEVENKTQNGDEKEDGLTQAILDF
jgi:topoisomerase-4 subunit A